METSANMAETLLNGVYKIKTHRITSYEANSCFFFGGAFSYLAQ